MVGNGGVPIYNELALRQTVAPHTDFDDMRLHGVTPIELILQNLCTEPVTRMALRQIALNYLPKPVYIPAELSHPRGLWLANPSGENSFLSRPSRLKAWFVQAYGEDAPAACSGCNNSWRANITAMGEHSLYPYHICRILPILSNHCANCFFSDRPCNIASTRSFMSSDRRDLGKAYQDESKVMLMPEYLNQTNSPRVLRLNNLLGRGDLEVDLAYNLEQMKATMPVGDQVEPRAQVVVASPSVASPFIAPSHKRQSSWSIGVAPVDANKNLRAFSGTLPASTSQPTFGSRRSSSSSSGFGSIHGPSGLTSSSSAHNLDPSSRRSASVELGYS